MQTFSGLLLSRHWRDSSQGVELVFWARSPKTPLRLVFPDQQAVCFIATETQLHPQALTGLTFQRKPLALHGLDGCKVDGLYFRHQRDLQRVRERTSQSNITLYESDIKPHDRFLMERFITAPFEVKGEPIQKPGYLEFVNPSIRPAAIIPDLTYVSLDIETDGSDGEILCIAISNPEHEVIFMQGEATAWETKQPIRWYDGEQRLLEDFFHFINALNPDLILGWNLINFDLDYIEQRCRRYRLPFALGRGADKATVLQPQQPGQIRIASLPGRVALDGIDTLKAAFWQFENFELDNVASELLGRKKLIEASENKMQTIRRLYRENRPALAAYNLEDCRLVEAIFEKTDLINFAVQKAVMTGLPLGRQGGSVAAFDNLYLPKLHRAGAVAHDIGAFNFQQSSPGGYVMDSQPGLYDNVLVLDFKSLYPSIIRTFHIDPFGLAFPGEDPVPGFLEAFFSRKKALLPEIIAELWQKREEAKHNQNKSLAQAIKIIMNAFYGVLGSTGCRFYDPRLASSITRRGHEIITRSREQILAQGFRVIYGDTDSLFVLLGPDYDETQAQECGNALATSLNRWWSQTLENEHHLASYLEIEFETHFIRFIMPTVRGSESGSKKRYAGYIRNNKGAFDLIFKGLESVRSDWTPLAQSFQRELYRRIFFNEPYAQYIQDTVNRLKSGEYDRELTYRKRLRQSLNAYRRNIPPHVQAARKMKNPGRWISYLITRNGPEPLSALSSPIDYQHYLDRQLAPVANSILHFLNDSFERITADQLTLF